MKKFIHEFKEFAMRGSVVQLAIGVVIGNAFNTIVTSLVNDIIMPVFGAVIGQSSLSSLSVVLRKSSNGDTVLQYGLFLQAIMNFLIITFSIFVVIRVLNKLIPLDKEGEITEEVETTPQPSEELEVLKQIRDALSKQ